MLHLPAQFATGGFVTNSASQDTSQPEGQLWLQLRSVPDPSSTASGSTLCCTPELLQMPGLLDQLRHLGALPAQLVSQLQHSPSAPQHTSRPCTRHASFYDAVVQQLDAVGWQHLLSMSEDLSELKLGVHDQAGRLHVVRVQLPPDYPSAAPSVSLQLPDKVPLSWSGADTLSRVAHLAQTALQRYQPLWDALDDLDTHTHVLEPHADAPRDYSCCSRRIALSRGASLHLTLNPASPGARPTVTFLGSSEAVGQLQRRWFEGSSGMWDPSRCVRANLEAVLQLQLPKGRRCEGGDAGEEDEAKGDCAICFAFHLYGPERAAEPGCVPSVVCSTPACSRAFHPRCLVEWLQSVASTRCFNTLFGECPYCNASISVPVDV